MKVTKSTIYKLEIERDCGCKVAGDYEDVAYKQKRGESVFLACEKHKDNAEVVEELLREVLDKEASEARPPVTMHPRTAALATDSAEDPHADQPAARTLRTAGSNGSVGRTTPRPALVTRGQHRPEPKAAGSGSLFRRSPPTSGLSAQAASKVASGVASGALEIDMEPAEEDRRVTNVLEHILGDDEGEDFDE